MAGNLNWHKVAEPDALAEDSVTTVKAGGKVLALTRCKGRYGALDGICPHRGGPLGQGSIEDGWLICPWHGNDYDALTGVGHDSHGLSVTSYPTELRDDGVYVGLEE